MNRKTANDPDLLIFDVDGVLIDTCDSFMHVTRDAIRWSWQNIYGGEADGEGYTLEHFNLCKMHPSFNDDSIVTWMLLSAMEDRRERTGRSDMRSLFPTLREWKDLLDTVDLQATEDSISTMLTAGRTRRLSLVETRTIVEEFYYGEETYRQLKGPHKYNIPGEGYWGMEKSALSRRWNELGLPVGIYTGRSPAEMELARRQLGWQDFPRDMLVCSGDGILKPSPLGLDLLCERTGATRPLFFGDTASDKNAWLNFGKGAFVAIGPILADEPLHFDTLEEALKAVL